MTTDHLSDGMYLVSAGGDAYGSEIVPLSGLDDAYLRTQWMTIEDIDPEERRAALEHLHDPDEWTYIDPLQGGANRIAFEFTIAFEDGWVRVARLPDSSEADRKARATAEPVAQSIQSLLDDAILAQGQIGRLQTIIREHEETIRQLVRAHREATEGETFMGEPVLPVRAPAASVAPEPTADQQLVKLWLRAALDCKEFAWDADQREMAEAALSGVAPEQP